MLRCGPGRGRLLRGRRWRRVISSAPSTRPRPWARGWRAIRSERKSCALAQSGEISRAESLLSGLSDAFLRGRARGDIVVAVGQGGDLRRALDLALSIEDIQARAGALVRLSALF